MSNLNELWIEYRSTGSPKAKDKLLGEYAGMVKYIAHRMAMNLPPSVEVDDLIGAGVMGLIRAVEMFEPDRGLKFEIFATNIIRQAIKDELNTMRSSGAILKESMALKPMALSLYFDLSEVSPNEIGDFISHLSDLYRSIGGDKLVISGDISILSPQPYPEPVAK